MLRHIEQEYQQQQHATHLYNQELESPNRDSHMYLSLNYNKTHQTNYQNQNTSKLFDLRKKYLKQREEPKELTRRSISHHNRVPTNRSPIKKPTQSPKQENTQPNFYKKKTIGAPKNLGSNLRNILKSNYAQQSVFEENPQNENIRKEFSQCIEIPQELQDIANYSFIKMLGAGATAEVKMAKHKDLDLDVAIKIYDKKKMTPMLVKNLSREVDILNSLKHPNIINLYHTIDNDKSIYLVMEYSSPTNLETFMKGKPFKRIQEEEGRIIFKQIAEAIAYMHSLNIMHRDMKFENILIDYNTRKVKIIDFGYSIRYQGKQTCSCGTPSYMAPELVKKISYDESVDTWACGIILYKILTGVFPFRGNSEKDLFKKICTQKPEYPSFISQAARQLINNMLSQKERPTMYDILQHNWMQ